MGGSLSARLIEPLEDRLFLSDTPVAPVVNPGGGLAAVGKFVYFTGQTSDAGREIWKTDGSPGGTRLIKDIVRGRASSEPTRLTAVGKTVFFRATDKQGPGLWATRGTAATTTRLTRLDYSQYVATKNALYFIAWHFKHPELWRSDGTVAGTKLVTKLAKEPQQLIAGDSVIFMNYTFDQFWMSDGTAAGTGPMTTYFSASASQQFVTVGDALYYEATDGGSRRIWRLDKSGTTPVGPGGDGLGGQEMFKAGNQLYYFVKGATAEELWTVPTGSSSAMKVATLTTPSKFDHTGVVTALNPPSVVTANGQIYAFYHYEDHTDGSKEMWRIDRFTGAMNKLADFGSLAPPDVDYPYVVFTEFAPINSGLVFNVDAENPVTGSTPVAYVCDSPTAAPRPISNKPNGFEIKQPVNAGGQLFFVHDSPVAKNRLWVWNYTAKKPPRRV